MLRQSHFVSSPIFKWVLRFSLLKQSQFGISNAISTCQNVTRDKIDLSLNSTCRTLIADVLPLLSRTHTTGPKRDAIQSVCGDTATWEMGHMGSHADIRGPLQCRQHFQFLETRIHILGESASRSAAGVAISHGHRHHEVLLPVRARLVRLQ